MTARELDVNTYILTDNGGSFGFSNPKPETANSSISYNLPGFTSIQTLSSNLDNEEANQVNGLMYVPSLLATDSCYNQTIQYVPSNVTRREDLPVTGQTVVALVPWFSIPCTKSYLDAASRDEADCTAVLFYQVNDTSTSTPPTVSNEVWNLDDGGQWKSEIAFPAYAAPGPTGRELMRQLSLYSGNLTTAPNGTALQSSYGANMVARLYADFTVDSGPSLPSLWVFLIIVLGVLLAIVTCSSILMGCLQRRRREALRRRVENGEVDLEALGVKQVNVPQDELNKLPLYIYKEQDEPTAEESTSSFPDGQSMPKEAPDASATKPESTEASQISPNEPIQIFPAHTSNHFSQNSCSICLDDFVSNTTTVRELPCRHIFHPECVDPFLLEHSSACPVCKQSVLPDGFFPGHITNAMVRRELLVRRIQDRRGTRDSRGMSSLAASQSGTTRTPNRSSRFFPIIHRVFGRYSRPISPVRAYPTITAVELNPISGTYVPSTPNPASNASATNPAPPNATTPSSLTHPQPPEPTQPSTHPQDSNRSSLLPIQSEPSVHRRRELAWQRAVANLRRENQVSDRDIEQEARRLPVWRRVVGKIFPGLTG